MQDTMYDKDITLSEVFECYDKISDKAVKGWATRYIGEILLNIDNQTISANGW